MGFNGKVSALKKAWRAAAADLDLNLVDAKRRITLAKASWANADFAPMRKNIARLMAGAPAFFKAHDYGWALKRRAYDFSSEPLNQLLILQAASALHRHLDPDLVDETRFDGLAARMLASQTIDEVSPRALPSRSGWRFVTIPFGWDDFAIFSLIGLVRFLGLERNMTLREAAALGAGELERAAETGWRGAELLWNSLASKAAVSVIPFEDMDVWEAHGILANALSGIGGAYAHGYAVEENVLAGVLWRAATNYAAAHEVGHHVMRDGAAATPLDVEKTADRLAYAALWDIDGANAAVMPLASNATGACFVSGLCFFLCLFMETYTSRAMDVARGRAPDADATAGLKERFKAWWSYTEQLARSAAEREDLLFDPVDYQGLTRLHQSAFHYLDQYSHWIERKLPAVLDIAREKLPAPAPRGF